MDRTPGVKSAAVGDVMLRKVPGAFVSVTDYTTKAEQEKAGYSSYRTEGDDRGASEVRLKGPYRGGIHGTQPWLGGGVLKKWFLEWAGTATDLAACIALLQQDEPYWWGRTSGRSYWQYRDSVYSETENLTADEVKIMLDARDVKKKRTIERARSVVEAVGSDGPRRDAIPDDIKIFVWQRDGGRCVRCDSRESLEFDHVIPLTMGGANTARNLQILCERCNREKGANLV